MGPQRRWRAAALVAGEGRLVLGLREIEPIGHEPFSFVPSAVAASNALATTLP
jgi:hypothetical protein